MRTLDDTQSAPHGAGRALEQLAANAILGDVSCAVKCRGQAPEATVPTSLFLTPSTTGAVAVPNRAG